MRVLNCTAANDAAFCEGKINLHGNVYTDLYDLENIYAIRICTDMLYGQRVELLQDFEYQDNWPGNPGYRIEQYPHWILNKDILNSMANPNVEFYDAVADARENHAGGITFIERTERMHKDKLRDLFLCNLPTDVNTKLLVLSQQEFAEIYNVLKDGVYVLCFTS